MPEKQQVYYPAPIMSAHSISKLKNLGPKSESWLNVPGVHSREDLEQTGAVDCYRILKAHGYPVSLKLVYAIEAALLDIHWSKLSAQQKQSLKQALEEQEQ